MPQTPLIWLIDDDPSTIDIIEKAFRKENVSCQLKTFPDVASLVSAIGQDGYLPHLLLVDYYMPDTNGLELIERLRNNPNTHLLKTVLFSQRITTDALNKAEELEVYQVANKPDSFAEWRTFAKEICLVGFFS